MQKNTKVPVFTSLDDPELIDIILAGGVGVLLTDTVYGLVGSANIPEAATRVIDAKGRKYKPGTLIAANTQQLIDLGIQAEHVKAAEQFWPGPVTVVLPTKPGLEYLNMGLGSLAVRVPSHGEVVHLLKKVGALLTTSANRPNEPMVTSIEEAQDIFGNRLNFYVDGGRLDQPLASTIIRVKFELLRQGAAQINPDALHHPDEPDA
ncbi:MAG TPA: L-threonylcarbamoyladenylate synthase [Candidatus Saccharimonadales bacterium]|nr:L-threonylcarbamoyladenylate synthase [Candidatus Saccharimonadales bacterium]